MKNSPPRLSRLLHFWAYSVMLRIWKSGRARVIHIKCGQVWGKGWEKKLSKWGKEEYFELSPMGMSYPQSYSQGFPPVLQRLIPQSTGSTTITTLINIY